VRAPRPIAARPRIAAACLLLAIAGSLLAFQPLRSPWWSGYDYDSVYVGSALRLFAGERSKFYDHPGAPLQEGLAAVFTAAWAVSDPGESRAERTSRWAADLDSTRPYLRVFGSFIYLASVLIVFATVAWVFRSAWYGLAGGLVFLAAPDVIGWAAVVKPDPLLAALSVAVCGLCVEGARRREAWPYLAAAFLAGYTVSVKLHAAGLVVPVVLAVALGRPRMGWWGRLRADAAAFWRAHRSWLAPALAVWLVLAVVLNALSALPAARPVLQLLAGLAALAALSAAALLVLRRTRAVSIVGLGVALLWSALAGAILPNLLYVSVPAPMLRTVATTLLGGGVNEGARPAISPLDALRPWNVLILLACAGLIAALRARDWTSLIWAAGAVSMGFLAFLRFGEYRYYAAAVALLGPLALLVPRYLAPRAGLIAFVVVALTLYKPIRLGIDTARDRGVDADRTERVNEWVESHLRPGEVALTQLESSDGRFFHLVRLYAPNAPERRYRLLPPDEEAAAYIREHDLRVRYVVTGGPVDAAALLASIGVPGRTRQVAGAPGFVYRVTT
jgi:hypothetical protein